MHLGVKQTRLIETRRPQPLQVRDEFCLDKNRRAAVRTKASAHAVAARSPDRVIPTLPGDSQCSTRHIEHGAKRAATRALTIPAVAVECETRLSRTLIANGSARTAARERGRHRGVLLWVRDC